jgi:CO/xanthine dehydrogenase Mo-binding subunit
VPRLAHGVIVRSTVANGRIASIDNAAAERASGEIAMVGVAPAITNAIFHAIGKPIRDLPVTPDKLL